MMVKSAKLEALDMYYNIHYPGQDDMIYATVRLRREQWESLRKYVSTVGDPGDDPSLIVFRYGACLVHQGRGWYRLVNYRTLRGVDKIKAALEILKAWYSKYEADRVLQLRMLLGTADNVTQEECADHKLEQLLIKYGRKDVNGTPNPPGWGIDTLQTRPYVVGPRNDNRSPVLR